MSIISVSVLGVFSVLAALTLKQYNKEISSVIIISAVVLLGLTVLPQILNICNVIKQISSLSEISEDYISVLIKSLGMCYITQVSSAICKENGSQSVAAQIELSGKIVILLLAIPIYNDVIEMITDFL